MNIKIGQICLGIISDLMGYVIQKKKRAWGCVAEDGSVFLPIQQGSEVLKQCILLVDIPKTILKQQRIVGFAGIVQAIRCLQQVPELFLSVKSISFNSKPVNLP